MGIAKRIGAFVFGAFVPMSLVVGAVISKTQPQAYGVYATLTFDLTIVGFAAIWAWQLARNKQGWRTIFVGAWIAATAVTIAVVILRDHLSGEPLATTAGMSLFRAGLYVLSFRLLAFAFQGPQS